MKLLVLYRPESEHASAVEAFLRDLELQHNIGNKLEVKDIDTRDGSSLASLYDIVQYPGVLVVDDFGSIVRSWQGDQLPLLDEVAGYITS